MRTTLDLDDDALAGALKVSEHRTKTAVIKKRFASTPAGGVCEGC